MTVKDELEFLIEEDGKLRVEAVHAWAQDNKESSIGRQLEWDDAKAGHQWRLNQIRQLIEVHLINKPAAPVVVSLSVDRKIPGGGYRRVDDVVKERGLMEIMFDDALRDLQRQQQKYERIKALAPVWDAIEGIANRRNRDHGTANENHVGN